MPQTIHFRIQKELDSADMQKVIKFKGALITGCYTEIIHIADHDENFHVNFFTVSSQDAQNAEDFIQQYISENDLSGIVQFIKGTTKPAHIQQ